MAEPSVAAAGSSRPGDLRLELVVELPPAEAMERVLGQWAEKLARAGLVREPRAGSRLSEDGRAFGTVVRFDLRTGAEFRVNPVTWREAPATELVISVQPEGSASRVSVVLTGWAKTLAACHGDLSEWFGGSLLTDLTRALTPASLGDWVVSQQARRPSGAFAVATYRDPTYHWPNFLLILDRLRLTPSDRLLEVACGGGAFLHRALASGCTAVGVDHSRPMLETAGRLNREAVARGSLDLLAGDAGRLPVTSGRFTACVCTGAFFFFPEPERAFSEMYRALAPGGRLLLFTETPQARGSPAAPEPFASRSRFYTPAELARLAERAGFTEVSVEMPDLEPYARAAGLPPEVVAVFAGSTGSVLLAGRHPPPGSVSAASPVQTKEV